MHRLVDFPSDVLFVIFSHLDLDTFLDLRLASKAIRQFVDAHLVSLCRAVALNNFGNTGRIMMTPPPTIYNLQWLNSLRYRVIASILLEAVSMSSKEPMRWMVAGNYLADGFRDQIAAGLSLADKFTRVRAKVAHIAPEQLPPVPGYILSLISSSEPRDDQLTQLEQAYRLYLPQDDETQLRRAWLTVEQQDSYCQVAPKTTIQGFLFARHLLCQAFGAEKVEWIAREKGPSVLWKHWYAVNHFPLPPLSSSTDATDVGAMKEGGWELVCAKYDGLFTNIPLRLFDLAHMTVLGTRPDLFTDSKPVFRDIFVLDEPYIEEMAPFASLAHEIELTFERWESTVEEIRDKPDQFDEIRLRFDPTLRD